MPLPNRKPAIKRKKIKTVREHRQFQRKLDNAIQKQRHGGKAAAPPAMKPPRKK
jgi:hypothetical protein